MPSDEILRARRASEPRWGELREQRVLGHIMEARRRTVAWRRVGRLGAGTLAFAAVVIAVVRVGGLGGSDPEASAGGSSSRTPDPSRESSSTISLADGSEAVLSPGASVEIREQSEHLVRLEQSAGEVVYDVRPNTARSFLVQVADVRVRVLGTRFQVAWVDEWVRVRVEHGRVRVDDGRRRVDLGAGEELRVRAVREAAARGTTAEGAERLEPLRGAPPPPTASERASVSPSVESLLARSDAARSEGRFGDAATAIGLIVERHPGDPRVPSALFTLGRVERARGRHAAAAAAFRQCGERAPQGPLAEDALAEEAASWAAAGNRAKAQGPARRYMDRFPHGTHADRMRRIAD